MLHNLSVLPPQISIKPSNQHIVWLWPGGQELKQRGQLSPEMVWFIKSVAEVMTPMLHFLSFVALPGNKLWARGHCNSSQSYEYTVNSHKAAEVKLRRIEVQFGWMVHYGTLLCICIRVFVCKYCVHPWIGVHGNTQANTNTHRGVGCDGVV